MAQWTTITLSEVTVTPKKLWRFTRLLQDEVEIDVSPEDITTTVDSISWQYETKWQPDGIVAACEAISAKYPEALVELDEEWDARDADEPGQTRDLFRGGVRIAEDVTVLRSLVSETAVEANVPSAIIPLTTLQAWHDALTSEPFPEITPVVLALKVKLLP